MYVPVGYEFKSNFFVFLLFKAILIAAKANVFVAQSAFVVVRRGFRVSPSLKLPTRFYSLIFNYCKHFLIKRVSSF